MDVNPLTKIKNLGVGKQQMVEIAKALKKEVRILILDEPTAALNETDSDNLLQLIRGLKEQGVTCILISHKLREVMEIADTITVLRDGKTVTTLDVDADKVNEPVLIKHMVGRSIDNIFPKRENVNIGEEVLRLENWSAFSYALGRDILKNVNISVHAGEIVGIAGLMDPTYGTGKKYFWQPGPLSFEWKSIYKRKRAEIPQPS